MNAFTFLFAFALEHAHDVAMSQSLFVLLVVPKPREGTEPQRYLVVEERDGTFYLPAGRVERGESLLAAGVRETLEEAGARVELVGLVGFDHATMEAGFKVRFVFVARPLDDAPLKGVPDEHGRGARWVTLSELDTLPLRDDEVRTWIQKVERGSPLLPLDAYTFWP